MKTLISTWTLLIASVFLIQAQDIKGYAIYKSQVKLDIQLDSTQMDDVMREQMMAMMKKQFEKEYTLTFNRDESIFKENEKLDSPSGAGGGGMVFVVAGSGAADALYKNVKENRFANQNELFGKEFLIQDTIPESKWEKQKETKNIGQYTCFKATYTKNDTIKSSFSRIGRNGQASDSSNVRVVERVVTAWYTPQVPVSHGPKMFGGLPGLVLEINDGQERILCSKIVLNPKEGISIKEPSKGKKVSQKEYDMILQKKLKEQEEQFGQDGRKRQDGNSFSIRIGG